MTIIITIVIVECSGLLLLTKMMMEFIFAQSRYNRWNYRCIRKSSSYARTLLRNKRYKFHQEMVKKNELGI